MLVSVVIPTYKRHHLLVRAVKSAIEQTYDQIEIIISNDDDDDTRIPAILKENFLDDPRIRLINNHSGQGQVDNTNHALTNARGEWIKILHDDDVLKPRCIEVLASIASFRPQAKSISCRSDRYFENELVHGFERGNRPYLESISPADIAPASYLMADIGGGLPSEQFIRRKVVEDGILLQQVGTLAALVDSCWNIRVRQSGYSLILNDALVLWCQGYHDTETTKAGRDNLDREFVEFREFAFNHIADPSYLPDLNTVQNYVRLVRASWRLKNGDLRGAIPLFLRALRPSAILLLLRLRSNKLDEIAKVRRRVEANHPEDI